MESSLSVFLSALSTGLSQSSSSDLKVSPEKAKEKGYTPLMVAVLEKASDSILERLATPETINAQDRDGKTALLHAASFQHLTRPFFTLLRLGADPRISSYMGSTPFSLAVSGGCHDRLQILLQFLEPEEVRSLILGVPGTLLSACVLSGAPDRDKAAILTSLLQVPGISPKPEEGGGASQYPLLHLVCRNGHLAAATVLLKAGADPSRPKADGWTPLHLAAFNGHFSLVSLLVSYGANIKTRLPENTTPSEFGGMTPRMLAKKKGYGKIRRLLSMHEWLARRTTENPVNERGLHESSTEEKVGSE